MRVLFEPKANRFGRKPVVLICAFSHGCGLGERQGNGLCRGFSNDPQWTVVVVFLVFCGQIVL